MKISRVCAAGFGGAIALFVPCYGVLHRSADAWRLFLALVPLLIIFILWMVDHAALERRVRRLEARSEIANERRVASQTDLTEVEHKLHQIEGRVVGIENYASPSHASQDKADSPEKQNGTGHTRLGCVDNTTIVRLPVNPQ